MKIIELIILAALMAVATVPAAAQTAGDTEVAAGEFRRPDASHWYRLTTRYNGTDLRSGRCIQYIPAGTEHAGMLWSADPVAADSPDYDYQLWTFVPSPSDPDRFKMICKADPRGFVNPQPTADNATARWQYVPSGQSSDVNPYEFIFVTKTAMSGVDVHGVSYCALATDRTVHNYYDVMNCGGVRQDYAINLWSDDYSEDANEWLFDEIPGISTGVEDISVSAGGRGGAIYDLSGRPVTTDTPAPGIYIMSGKKLLIK